MPIEHIYENDSLNTGRNKINDAIDASDRADRNASKAVTVANDKGDKAVETAERAEQKSDSTQQQLDNIVIESGTSDAEVIQARTDAEGTTYNLLKNRLDVGDSLIKKSKLDCFTNDSFFYMPSDFLNIPSTLGNGLTTHPSVVDFGNGEEWNGYRYWMAHTPYPGVKNENPSIAVSNDNITWVVPDGVQNPLVPPPGGEAYNSDVELVYISDTNRLRIYYRESGRYDGKNILYYIESTDGLNWSDAEISLKTDFNILSPSIVYKQGDWKMWTVENKTAMHLRTSTDGVSWSDYEYIYQPWENWSVWHIGVYRDVNNRYHLLGSVWESENDKYSNYRPIVYANSDDAVIWRAQEKPQLIPSGWFGGYLYRPTFLIDESKGEREGLPYVRMWFSGKEDDIADGWHVGYTEGFILGGNTNSSATGEYLKRKKIADFFKTLTSKLYASFAYIARLKTKRIEVSGDFSQPLIEFYDNRTERGGGNYLREHYHGNEDKSLIRHYFTYVDNAGETRQITIQPFNDYISFSDPTTINNIKQLDIEELVTRGGGRFYSNDDDYNRIASNGLGELEVQLYARGGDKKWIFKSVSGELHGGGGHITNIKYIRLTGNVGISSASSQTLFEDFDGKLKYKNSNGVVTNLT